ncbi:hypothetical protein V493_00525 [Pseudogymnoascus sp. VKM F-4281 (FW-2241)]|nr:hypothetical protein V493_00525 [Pseudogymnoascus sp. VKM F-4281 (FW-2241)]
MTSAAERTAALTEAHNIVILLSAHARRVGNTERYFMTELAEIFDELDLAQYLDNFLEQGFDTWETILDITEPDFDVLGVKLGHRRKLQRKIAATRGIRHGQALASPKRSSSGLDDKLLEEGKGVTTSRSGGKHGSSSVQPSKKRKYRRHPKPDENAPARPHSSCLLFSKKMREDLRGKSLSFTEIAKLVGKKWHYLTPSEKEIYEQQGFTAKKKSMMELVEYRKTKSYKTYSEYLLDLHRQESSQETPNEASKVPKLQNIPSATSTGTAKCSTTSSLSHEVSSDVMTRGLSLGSIPGPWFPTEHVMQTAMQTAVVPDTLTQASAGGPSTTLTEYCDLVIRSNPQMLARRGHARHTDIPILEYSEQNERNASPPRNSNDPDTSFGILQTLHNQQRSLDAFSPPSLTSKSTTSTLQSILSSRSRDSQSQRSTAMYFAPRKPLEQSCRRSSLPNIFDILNDSRGIKINDYLPELF